MRREQQGKPNGEIHSIHGAYRINSRGRYPFINVVPVLHGPSHHVISQGVGGDDGGVDLILVNKRANERTVSQAQDWAHGPVRPDKMRELHSARMKVKYMWSIRDVDHFERRYEASREVPMARGFRHYLYGSSGQRMTTEKRIYYNNIETSNVKLCLLLSESHISNFPTQSIHRFASFVFGKPRGEGHA